MCNTNTISSIFIGTAKCYLQLYYVKKKICFQYYSIPLNCVIQNKSKSGRNSCKKTEQMATKNIVLVVTVYLLLSANQKVYWVVNFFLLPFLYCVGILKFSFLSKQWENLCYAYCVIYIIHSHFNFIISNLILIFPIFSHHHIFFYPFQRVPWQFITHKSVFVELIPRRNKNLADPICGFCNNKNESLTH